MKIIRILLLVVGVFVSLSAHAVVIWSESIDGDLSNFSTPTDLGTLVGPESFNINAIIDGGPTGATDDGLDERDILAFTTTGSWTLDILLPQAAGTSLAVFLDGVGVGASSTTIDAFGTIAAGAHEIRVFPSGNQGRTGYGLQINVASSVPEPSIIWLLGSGLALIGLVRRKTS